MRVGLVALFRRPIRLAALLLLAAVGALACPSASAAQRVALVVGNGDYAHVPSLGNPKNDAADIAAALTRLGFDVETGHDLDRDGMWQALRRLVDRAASADAAVFYYSGHGIQRDGANYLIPVDAELKGALDLPAYAIRLGDFMGPLQSAGRANLIFLDACRDNPLAALPGADRGLAFDDGLAPVRGGSGTFIAYATDPDRTASDGRGRNSPFSEAVLRHIEEPGLEVRGLMTKVRRDVLDATDDAQRPWAEDGLNGTFYFAPPRPAPPAYATQGQTLAEMMRPREDVDGRPDLVTWLAIQNSRRADDFALFLSLYPGSPLRPLALARMAEIDRAPAAPSWPEAPAAPAALRPAEPPAPTVEAKPDTPEAVVAAIEPREPTGEPPPPAFTDDRAVAPRVAPIRRDLVVTYPAGVNLRAGPSVEDAKLGYVKTGVRVAAVGEVFDGAWYEVTLDDGRRGFIAGRLLGEAGGAPALGEAAEDAAAPAVLRPGVAFRDCPDCPTMVAVAPQNGVVGSDPGEEGRAADETVRRYASFPRPLAVGRRPVTFAEWDACVAGGGCRGYRPADGGLGRGNRTATGVSYYDVLGYLAWLTEQSGKTYRLLDEEEWELLARAGDQAPAPAFDASGPNGLGLVGMVGGAKEWTSACHGDRYRAGDACTRRTIRGGPADGFGRTRYAARAAVGPFGREPGLGFRVVRAVDEAFEYVVPPVAGR